jgi:BolA family transcriptional regulator, general stress-responsive regulator
MMVGLGFRETAAMRVEEQITKKLRQAFAPEMLEVVNDSHRHAGHAGSPGTGESHFSIKVVSRRFAGKSRVERHRMVNEVLAEELAGPIHALAISALTPEERSRPL